MTFGADRGPGAGVALASRQSSAGDIALAPAWELAALAALTLMYLVFGDSSDADTLSVVNTLGPVALMVILGTAAVRAVMSDSANLWAALFWFRVATVVYFGFGALVPLYGNDATKAYINIFHMVDGEQICATNLLTAAGVFVTLSTARLVLARPVGASGSAPRKLSLVWIGLLFALIGFSVKLLIIVPYTLGQISGEIASGAVLNVGSFATVSLYLLTRYAMNERPSLMPLLLVLLAFDIGVGMLTYSKGAVLTSAIMFMLGYLSRGTTQWRILVTSVGVVTLMTVLVPITDFGRIESGRRFGTVFGGTLSERFDILSQYFNEARANPVDRDVQGTLVRLSYTNAVAFAMHRYNSGLPGHSLDNILALPIPRFLWPEKPNITDVGQDFNELALGSRTSGSAPGLFGDAYWDFGWWGLLLMVPLGIIYAGLSRYALWVQANQRWVLFPVVMLAVRMGFRVDGFLISDIFGTLFIVLGGHVCMVALEKVLLSRTRAAMSDAPSAISVRHR